MDTQILNVHEDAEPSPPLSRTRAGAHRELRTRSYAAMAALGSVRLGSEGASSRLLVLGRKCARGQHRAHRKAAVGHCAVSTLAGLRLTAFKSSIQSAKSIPNAPVV